MGICIACCSSLLSGFGRSRVHFCVLIAIRSRLELELDVLRLGSWFFRFAFVVQVA